MHWYSYLNPKEYPIHFVTAFDKLKEQRRKLFGIEEIDNQLNFSDKKNICIVNSCSSGSNILYSLFAQFCVDFCGFSDDNNIDIQKKQNKTILIDARNGSNLGHVHQNLIEHSIKTGFTINKVPR